MNLLAYTIEIMDIRKLKKSAFGILTDTEEVDETLTQEDAHKIYLKIIRKVHSNIKDKGFIKRGSVNLYRIENEISQRLNFQKSVGGLRLTINTAIRPIFWNRTEDYYLLTSKRIGEFDTGMDTWYPIKRDYLAITEYLTFLINERVLPHFEKCNSPRKVIQNIAILENEKHISYDDLILFSALRESNYETSLRFLEKKLESLLKEDVSIDWVNNDKKFYSEMHELVKQKNFSEINSRLDSFKEEFIKKNNIVAKTNL
jgi:hypothetical protein